MLDSLCHAFFCSKYWSLSLKIKACVLNQTDERSVNFKSQLVLYGQVALIAITTVAFVIQILF